jgi:hypothetical protein
VGQVTTEGDFLVFRIVKPLAIAAVLIASLSSVQAAPMMKSPLTPDHAMTAEQLYVLSTSGGDGKGVCAIYVMGVAEGMIVAGDKEFCPPGNFKYDAMAVGVTEALRRTQWKDRPAVFSSGRSLECVIPL